MDSATAMTRKKVINSRIILMVIEPEVKSSERWTLHFLNTSLRQFGNGLNSLDTKRLPDVRRTIIL